MKRIHIVGCGPRSGTTLLMELMTTCFEINLFTKHEDRISLWPSKPCNIFLTKSPQDIKIIGPILKWVPNLYVLYMLRDPRDMVVSRHGSHPELYWSGLNFWKIYHPYGKALSQHPRFIIIKYEDLVSSPDQIQKLITKQIPFLVPTRKFSEFHQFSSPTDESLRALGGVRPVNANSVGNWQQNKARLAGQLILHGPITDDLIAYGYEKDEQWERNLDGIEPDLQKSHWPEFFPDKEYQPVLRNILARIIWVLIGNSRLGFFIRHKYFGIKTLLLSKSSSI